MKQRLLQIGFTMRDRHPIYLVEGVTITDITNSTVTDSNGTKWRTQHSYIEDAKIGDQVYITHVHGTAQNVCLSSTKRGFRPINEHFIELDQ